MKKVMLFAIVLALLIGCSKKSDNFVVRESNGITFYNNTEVPNDPTAKLGLKKLFTISSDAQSDSTARMKFPVSIIEDKDKNFYILDSRAHNIKKFNNLGEFQKTISRQGQGPGELTSPNIIFIDNDTLTVYSVYSSKISKFDLNGKFYYEKIIDRIQFQDIEMSPNGNKFVSYLFKTSLGEKKDQMKMDLSVINLKEMKEKNTITSEQFNQEDYIAGKINYSDMLEPFAAGNNFMYLSDNTDYQFKIVGYDYAGNKKMEIKKTFKKIMFEKEEKVEYYNTLKKVTQTNKEIVVPNFKNAIQAIHVDKYGRVLVIPSIDRHRDEEGLYIDIFKDGKFLNRVNYELHDKSIIGKLWMISGKEYFSGTRMYLLNKKDMMIDVYDY
ncbi:MAG: 6-bladed beta-propeller [Candidatus Delongbacteria bacterium]|nr:6-bladed beta-propeller [Candidatus Delongbacteria bacterium]